MCASRLTVLLFVSLVLAGSQEQQAQIVDVAGDRITVNIKEFPLDRLLETITRATGINISASRDADQELISAELRNVSLEDGLRTLLGGLDAFFMYSADGKEKARLRAVWVYRRGEAKALRPAPPETVEVTHEILGKLKDPDPAVRARAFRVLVGRPGADAGEAIRAAVLQEKNDGVRATMIEDVLSSGSELPPDIWGALVSDPAEQIRILALDALRGSSNVREFATVALTDSSPHIRQRAQEMMKEIEAAGSAPH